MSTRSAKQNPRPTQNHCRYCNHTLEKAKQRCPACKRGQERAGEVIALALMLVVMGVVLYLLVTEEDKFQGIYGEKEPPPVEISYSDAGDAVPAASAFQVIREQSNQSAVGDIILKQLRASKSAPIINYQGTRFRQTEKDFPFYVAEKKWNSKTQRYDFYRRGMQGAEVPMRGEARRYFISENQGDYPEPESGCGPTALLNLYVWYSKFGLLDESIQHSDQQRYKQLKFQQIDRKIREIQKQSRTDYGGTNTVASIVAMDELVQQYSKGPTRLHFEIKKPPLSLKDFNELSRNYRAGILSVRPKDRQTGALLGNHAVLCIRGDKGGMITIANWGEFSHGALVQRKDGQWFVPRDRSHHELKINNLTVLVPFTPKDGA
ncbi:hypothetical protein DDZ13_12260 [Coraliomargarita sinensis]|uniref:Uncharacterized protein n=1 Tax=Coraliomargarita sinensis TaxID=2174842 RepID=A0A317ZI57_9BACT|nr:hypothetical protein [Coraliomargarita sinensis]PXA03459.1 hypothetical protein DDZ13_12260 [Coraliomargarita sinensis]